MKNKVIQNVVTASVHIQEGSTSTDSMCESTILCIELNVYAGVSAQCCCVYFCVYNQGRAQVKLEHFSGHSYSSAFGLI